jgi:hypothetical protein
MQGMYAMELVNCHDKKNDVAIEMHHFWSNDYHKNINGIKDLDLKSIRSCLKSEIHLSSHSDTLNHLLYLSTIRKNDDRTLFTQKQQNKFDAALTIKKSVSWSFGINGAIITCTSLFPLVNLAGLSQCSNATQYECLSQIATIMTPTAISVAGALAVGFVSLYATGISPDISSRRANKVQDEIGCLNRQYATIAKYWIDIHFSCPEKAHYIARKIDIEELKIRAGLKTHKTKIGCSLITPLEEAWHFIKHNTVLITFTEIENYLYNKIHSKHIERLDRRIEFLEKIVQEKDAEIEKLRQEKI